MTFAALSCDMVNGGRQKPMNVMCHTCPTELVVRWDECPSGQWEA